MRMGTKKRTRYSGTAARMPTAATIARPPGLRRCSRSPTSPPTIEKAAPSWNIVAKMLPTTIAVSSLYPCSSARSRKSTGSHTSEPNATCAVRPCSTSQRLVRRRRMPGRSSRLIR
jgi:hypothetical protein